MMSEKLETHLSCGALGNLNNSLSQPAPSDNLKVSTPSDQLKKDGQKLQKDPLKSNKKLKKKKPQIVFNVSDTKYEIVKYVGKELFQWKLVTEQEGGWDVYWTDSAVHPETLARMLPYQKINHFPGMYSLARKNHLGRYLMRMRKIFPDNYKFFPRTFLLPSEYMEFRSQFNRKNATFIVKPEASCQGRGIFLTRTWESVEPGEHYVIQKYMDKPYLIDGLKFDLRIYVLLAGCDPLRIYVYKDGLARFATEPYLQPWKNLTNMCMHLTNYAINKGNPNFVFNTSEENANEGHKRSLKAIFNTLESQGHDVDKLWKEIKKIIIKTFCSVQPILAHTYRSCQGDDPYNNMCFEVLGFDIILDHQLKPFLLEVNHTPSFTTDTPFDRNVKMNVIKDALTLMNISLDSKFKYKKTHKSDFKKRVLTGKTNRTTFEERQAEIEKAQKERDEWESKNLGGYEKVYPIDDPSQCDEKYEDYLKETTRWWEEWTGTSVRRREKRDSQQAAAKPLPMVFGRGSSPAPPSKQSERTKEVQSATLSKTKFDDRNSRPLSHNGRTGNIFMRQERASVPKIRKTDQLMIPGDPHITLSSDWSPKNQDVTLSFVEGKNGRKSYNTDGDGDDQSPILGGNPADVFVIEEDFDWAANDSKMGNMEDRCMVRQRSKTTSIRVMDLGEANNVREKQREEENKTEVRANISQFFMKEASSTVRSRIQQPDQQQNQSKDIKDLSSEVKTAYNRRNKNLMNLIRLKLAGGQPYNRTSAEIIPQNIEFLAQPPGKKIAKYPNIKINNTPVTDVQKPKENVRLGHLGLLLAKRRPSVKPLPKQSSFSLQRVQVPQIQPRAHSILRVNKVHPSFLEEEDYKDQHMSFSIQGHRPVNRSQVRKEMPARGGPGNMASNLLYSKEKFTNMQKILDSFIQEEKK